MMKIEFQVFWIAMGGSLGALTRYAIGCWFTPSGSTAFAWGTLIANCLGCFLAGILLGCAEADRQDWIRLGIGVGFLGALTTFSSFGVETVRYLKEQQLGLACVNIAGNLVLSLAMVVCGSVLGSRLRF